MSEMPIVSVCIPTFNRSGMLLQALRSVLDQSLRNIEVIVSDNCSTDDTADLVRWLAAIDPRVHYAPTSTNIGLFGNLTRCLTLGTGRYRVVLPDDDLMLPGNLEQKARFLDEHPSAGMVHSSFRQLDSQSRPTGPATSWTGMATETLQPGREFIATSIWRGGIVCVSSVMLRSSVVAEEVFDAADGPYADLGLWLRIADRGDVGFLPAALSGFRVHGGSASSGFQTVRVRGNRHQITKHHADALLQAHGRFVARPELGPADAEQLRSLLVTSDRRLRLAILARQLLPPKVLSGLKRAARWRPGSKLHGALSLYSAPGQPQLASDANS